MKIGDDQMFYCRQRGLDPEEAVALIVNGFCRDVLQNLPMEFAVEAQKLVGISLEVLGNGLVEIENLHAGVDEKTILNGFDLTIEAGEVHAIMGPNGSGKSTLSYVLAGRDGYEAQNGAVRFDGADLLDMEPEARAIAGMFLAFQYPLEIPGVTNMTFLRTALNAVRRGRGEEEMDPASFLRTVREKSTPWVSMTTCSSGP